MTKIYFSWVRWLIEALLISGLFICSNSVTDVSVSLTTNGPDRGMCGVDID